MTSNDGARSPAPPRARPVRLLVVDADRRVRGSLAGCDAYLAKPLVPAELAAVIARHRDLAQVPQRRRRS